MTISERVNSDNKLGDFSTKVEISHYYSTPRLKAKLLNLVPKGKIARDCIFDLVE